MIVLTITNSRLIPRSCGLKYFQYANMRGREGRNETLDLYFISDTFLCCPVFL